MSANGLILPQVPVLFAITMRGSIADMTEEQARFWLVGKLSTINLNSDLEIKVRRMTPEELAGLPPG
jgi:hypothetical protein